MDVDVDNDLQCPICLELYTYPIILPCSHVLCRSPCAEHLFDFNFIRCPVCRDNCYVSGGISSLPRVIALENIIERYKKEQTNDKSDTSLPSSSIDHNNKQISSSESNNSSTNENLAKSLSLLNSSVHTLSSLTKSLNTTTDIKCQHCKSATTPKRAKKYCTSCGSHFCATCLRQNHPNREPFNTHEFVEPGTQSSRKVNKSANNRPNEPRSAAVQKTLIDSYCSLCTQPFPSGTEDSTIHTGHPVVPIEQAYREFKVRK